MFIRVLIVVVTMPLLPAICRADLIISTTNTQTLLTFDVDHAGVFTLGTGTNAGSAATGLAEATQFNARGSFNPNKLGGLHTEGVSSSHRFFTPGRCPRRRVGVCG